MKFNKRGTLFGRLSVFLFFILLIPSFANATNNDPFHSGREAVSPKQSVGVAQSSGAMTYSYPLAIPPGRNGMQPNLTLSYSSAEKRQDSLFGYGWSLSLPYIERVNKVGTNNFYNQDRDHTFFTSSLSGELLPVKSTVPLSGGFLAASESTLPLATFALPNELPPFTGNAPSEQPTESPHQFQVSATDARSFHTFQDTFLPLRDFHPNYRAEFEAASAEGALAAKSPAAGFPVVDNKAISTVLEEDVSARTLTTKKFTVQKGDKIESHYRIYPAPVHYLDSVTHKLEDVNPQISTTTDGFSMTHAPYQVMLDKAGLGSLLSVTNRGKRLSVDVPGLAGSLRLRATQSDPYTVTYPDLLGASRDLEIITGDHRLTENIVLRDASAVASTTVDMLDVPFTLSATSSLILTVDGTVLSDTPLTSSESVRITDKQGNFIANILPPVAVSAVSTSTDTSVIPIEITYTKNSNGSITMTKHIPLAWLSTAAYPVRSDATYDFYPDTNAVDGILGVDRAETTWANIRGATSGDFATPTDLHNQNAFIGTGVTSGKWIRTYRGEFLFDTSSLPDSASISSATLNIHGSTFSGETAVDNFSQSVVVDRPTPASNTTLAVGDYNLSGKWDGVEQSSNRITVGSWTNTGFNTFTLNSTGRSNVSLTGITKLGLRLSADFDNVEPTWAGPNTYAYVGCLYSETSGTSNDPYLEVITSTGPSAPTNLLVDGLTNPSNIATTSPHFTAIHANASTTALATSYELQVSTTSAFTSTYWDSGQQTLSSSTPVGQRTPQIFSTTTFAKDGSTYYWRIKLWDSSGGGAYSGGTDYFTMSAGSTTLQDLRYTYDAVGNILTIVDKSGTNSFGSTTYTYDNLYRLTRASTTNSAVTDWLQTYSYDNLGNILSKSDVGAYVYGGTGYTNPHGATSIAGVTYTYDTAGNVTNIGSNVYTWNYRNRLTDSNVSATTTHYGYDANDSRVSMAVKKGGATTTTLYFGKLQEVTGATTTMYIFAGDTLVATIEGNGTATSTNIVHTDQLNSTAVVSDGGGNLKQLLNSYPYGALNLNQQQTTNFNEKRQYIGQYYDDQAQLSYLNARYYSGTNGRFMSQDPLFLGDPNKQNLINPQELNSYSYAANNPIRWSDPLGLWINSGDGSFIAQKGDTLSKLQVQTGRDWHDTGFSRDPRTLQIGEKVSFAPVVKTNTSPTIYNSTQAVAQYYGGKGESVNLGGDIQKALQNSPEQKTHQENIVTGKTSSDNGNYGVDLTKQFFFIGSTPVDYSTTRGTKYGVTTFTGFVRDGFWDPIGLNIEVGGKPYAFNPVTWIVSYPNPK